MPPNNHVDVKLLADPLHALRIEQLSNAVHWLSVKVWPERNGLGLLRFRVHVRIGPHQVTLQRANVKIVNGSFNVSNILKIHYSSI